MNSVEIPPLISDQLAQLERLVAYVPVTLVRQIVADGLPSPGRPRLLDAATLFSDISGFTAMSEELGTDGPRGAEEVNRVLLLTFTGMIDLIHRFGGAVSHFYGDAMSVYFPDEDGSAVSRALACAQQMQQLMLTNFSRIETNRPVDKNPIFDLTIKIGLSYGPCQEIIVGDAARVLEFVLTGTAVDEAAAAEHEAEAGQIVVSQALLRQLGRSASTPFAVWTEPVTPLASRPLLPEPLQREAQLRLLTAVTPFVPQAIHERMSATGSDNLAEHRPVTSLFVQFELNGRAVATQLQAYFNWASTVVARFGSRNARLNRVLTGDKGNQLHIIFGAPVAPDAPDQALLCALALQRERPDYVVVQRIGLAAGKVFAGPVGSASRREYTVVGDVVNLSARLMQVCEDGAVITGETTAQRVRDLIAFAELPPVQVKGKQAPVKLFRAQQQQATTTQLQAYYGRWQRSLVGRDTELTRLRQELEAAQAGNGRSLLICGPIGVGKTRFLAAGVRHWLAADGRGLVGVCQPHTADTPYAPWRNIWNDLIGLNDSMSAQEQAATVVAWTLSLVPDAGDDVGLWTEVLGLPIGQSERLKELTAEVRQARFFALVRRCLQRVAANQPLLIILEDIHWADQATIALVDELGQQLASMPICLVLTSRDAAEDLSLKISQQETTTLMTLQDLSPTYARQVLAQLLGTDELPATVEQHLGLRDREGRDSPVNPLFLEEALRVMMGLGVLQVNGRVQVDEARLSQMQLPDTIHGMLLARLDRLPAAGRHLLQVASVIGRQFAREPLSRMVPDVPIPTMADLLTDLSAEEITQLVTADPEWIYLFQHAMTHEVAYESLPYARRQALHAAVADWLVGHYADNLKPITPVLAYHYDRADLHEPALEYALAAADAARNVFANREAVELYTLAEKHLKALGEGEQWETAVRIYLERGSVYNIMGQYIACFSDAEQVLKLPLSGEHKWVIAQAYNLMADVEFRQSKYEEVLRLTNAVMQFEEDIASDELARAYILAGWAKNAKLQYEEALRYLRKAEKICLETNNKQRLALALEATSNTYFAQRELEMALEAMRSSVQLSHEYSTPLNLGISLNNLASIQFTLGKGEQSLTVYSDAVDIGRNTSNQLLALALVNRAGVQSYLGFFDKALTDFEEANRLFNAMNDEYILIEAYLLWGIEYCLTLGLWEDAAFRLDRAYQLIYAQLDSYPEECTRLHLGLGQLYWQTNKLDAAREEWVHAQTVIHEKNLIWWKTALYYYQAHLQLGLGDTLKAYELFQASIDSVKNGGCPDWLPLANLFLAKLEVDNTERCVYFIKETLNTARQRARYSDKVFCFEEAGNLLLKMSLDEFKKLGEACVEESVQLKKERGKFDLHHYLPRVNVGL
ncbi:MAG: adenylate/guanylate cyclase domain-containing protein [Chloroflexota bacterium]